MCSFKSAVIHIDPPIYTNDDCIIKIHCKDCRLTCEFKKILDITPRFVLIFHSRSIVLTMFYSLYPILNKSFLGCFYSLKTICCHFTCSVTTDGRFSISIIKII